MEVPADPPPPPSRRGIRLPRLGRRGRWILALALLAPVVALLHRVGDAARGTPVRSLVLLDSLPSMTSPAFREMAAAGAEVTFTPGNRVELLVDGAFFTRAMDEVAAARSSVTVFMYFCAPGAVGEELVGALASAVEKGARAWFLGDGFGCRDFLGEVGPDLRAAGVRVASFRPVHWWALHQAQHRNHARTVVVDGRVAFTGGVGLADVWAGGGDALPWRDTNLRLEGPAVTQVQAAFVAAWATATGELLAGEALVASEGGILPSPDPAPGGGEPPAARGEGGPGPGGRGMWAGLLVSRPGGGASRAERWFALTLSGARRTLWIANSYFVPNRETRRLLLAAEERGVDVRILVPGPINDVPGTRWAGQRWFGELLRGGVRIFEYQGTMMHAKTVVADGVWGTVGSVNLDNRSMRLNEEWTLVFQDPELGAAMDSLYLADLDRARERTLEIHRSRPLQDRLREWVVSLVAPFF